jgi:hypothetical protein
MPICRTRLLFLIPLCGLLLGNFQCSVNDNNGSRSNTSVRVDSEQKIADSSGGFHGELNTGDHFGSAATSLGDLESDGVTDLAVGAPDDDTGGTDRGAVWILFMDSDGRVDTQQRIADHAGGFDGELDDGDRFGAALASIGNLNGDNVTHLAVGAPGDDEGGTDRGAVWILFLNAEGRVWRYQKIADSSGGFHGELHDGDQFGSAVASVGDIDGDGIDDLAVGAPFANEGGTGKGEIWILFMDNEGRVKSQQRIADSAGGFKGGLSDNDHFGNAIASIGDLDANGVTDLAVGAEQSDEGGTDRGAVWILFLNQEGRVNSQQRIADGAGGFKGDLNDGDQFGSAVADAGDLDGDGVDELAVGADRSDEGGPERGAVWLLFMDPDGRVKSQQRIADGAGGFEGKLNDGEQFGAATAGIGNLDDRELRDLAVGAPGDDEGGADKGAVWILFMKQRN